MRRADRLFRIVQSLRDGRLTTARRLADEMEVSERTIYRDIADLQASGVPIDGEAGVGYVMRKGFDLPPLMFTRDEIAALMTGARMVSAWGGAAMALSAHEAISKIETVLPSDLAKRVRETRIYAPAVYLSPDIRERIDLLDSAIAASRRIHFRYQAPDQAMTVRTVRPLGLFFWASVWTLTAWCELRADFRSFRIDRISVLDIDGAAFQPEPGKTLADALARELGEMPDDHAQALLSGVRNPHMRPDASRLPRPAKPEVGSA